MASTGMRLPSVSKWHSYMQVYHAHLLLFRNQKGDKHRQTKIIDEDPGTISALTTLLRWTVNVRQDISKGNDRRSARRHDRRRLPIKDDRNGGGVGGDRT